MRLILLGLGKRVRVFCESKVPDNLGFLPGVEEIRPADDCEDRFDLFLSVDASDRERLGSCITLMARCAHTAQIDHHAPIPDGMEVNSVDGKPRPPAS